MMRACELKKLTLPSDFAAFLSLPLPERSDLCNADKPDVFAVARNCLSGWLQLARGDIQLPARPVDGTCPSCDGRIQLEGPTLWSRLLFSLATYYEFAASELNRKGLPEGEELIPGLRLDATSDFINAVKDKLADIPPHQAEAASLAWEYLLCWQASYFYGLMTPTPLPRSLLCTFASVPPNALRNLHDYERHRYVGRTAAYLVSKRLEHLAEVYANESKNRNKEHRAGIFSNMRLAELALLAKRDPAMLQTYGHKHVEKVFEHQLALIAQSFKFYVVSTRTAESTVDLVCISSVASPSYTFLLEAKTTARPYTLPTKNGRAVLEYIEEVKNTLRTLPKLEFLLIVGPEPSKTLNKKVAVLERKAGIPVRYCRAQSLADLREAIPGPIPQLKDDVIAGAHVLPCDFTKDIVEHYEQRQRAHATFVRSLLIPRLQRFDGCTPDGQSEMIQVGAGSNC